MLSRTFYSTVLILIFVFGCALIYAHYDGNEYMYLNSLCAGAIFLSHIYANNYTKGKSKLTEILPLPIALLTSCFLLFSYLSAIQNPTGHQIFLGVIITLTYVIDLSMIDSFAKQNLEKKWVIPLLVKICLFLISIGAIQISGLSWFKIILLFIAFLCTFGSVVDRIQQLRDNKVIFSLIIFIDMYLVYLSIKTVLITDDKYHVVLFSVLLLSFLTNFNKEETQATNSEQALITENDKQNQITANSTVNMEEDDNNEDTAEDDEENEEDYELDDDGNFDYENATLKGIIDRRIAFDDKFNENITKRINLLNERLKLSINNVELLEEITEELNDLKDNIDDEFSDLNNFIDECNNDIDLYVDEMGIEEYDKKIKILCDRLEKKRLVSEALIKMMEDMDIPKENDRNSSNHEQQESTNVVRRRRNIQTNTSQPNKNETKRKGRRLDL